MGPAATVALIATAAGVHLLEVLGPDGAVSPDGFEVGVVSDPPPSVEAEGAAVASSGRQGKVHTFRVEPAPGRREVRLRARSGDRTAERTFAVGPPAAIVSMALAGPPPVKGRDTSAAIDVRVLGAGGAVDADASAPHVRANVGRIEALERAGPGHFRARYVLPETRHPEVAVIVGFAPWPHPGSVHGAVGSLLVPLASSIDLPGQTEPNAQMSIEIAGASYGPTSADASGRFRIPVVVPPGHRFGTGTAVDRAGNRRVTRVDLHLPPTDQLACVVNPARLPADGRARARVICASSDPYGGRQKKARIDLNPSVGTRSAPRAIGEGLTEWIYTAPPQLRAPRAELAATWRDGRNTSREALAIDLTQGPAARALLVAEDPLVHEGGRPARLEVRVADALGRPLDGATVEVTASKGAVGAVSARGGGAYDASWRPSPGAERAQVKARAFGPAGSLPSKLIAFREGDEVWVAVQNVAGEPVPDQVLRVGDREVRTRPDGAARIGPLRPGAHEVRHAQWGNLRLKIHVLDGGAIWPSQDRPGALSGPVELVVAPPVPVNVRVAVDGREVTWWAEDPSGRVLPNRPLAVHVDGGELARPRTSGGRTTARIRGRSRAQLSVADVETGVTAVAEVPP